MTYTQRTRAKYAAMILMSRAWHDAYQQLRAVGWNRAAACELANLTVGGHL